MSTPQEIESQLEVAAEPSIGQRLLTEFIGTFFLVFTIVMAVSGKAPLAALAIGSVLMVMVFAGGHVSGAHYNPAVTLAVWIRGRVETAAVAPYMITQLLAAAVAALLGNWVYPDNTAPDAFAGAAMGHAFMVEVLFTFALAYVVLNAATAKANDGNSFFGLAIGFTVLAGAISVGTVSGGAFNPAVALGVSIAKLSAWGSIWLLIIADLIGGALAAVAFKYINPADR